jgi:predicted nucleotide-binding protein (sugar kinase/HSP70/actin superfamily)
MEKSYIPFTEEMKKDYTVLVPNMLPMHFTLMCKVLKNFGIRTELLTTSGQHIKDMGLRYVHNDTCYPAILVIGQFLDALQSGKYDPHKVALILFQTGGGCRASNYINLLRKALEKAGFGYVPVISMSLTALEDHPGFKMTVPMIHRLMYAILYADLLMLLRNQCRPYEIRSGQSEELAEEWTARLTDEMMHRGALSRRNVNENYRRILSDFAAIPRREETKVKVGIVGEIFVKFSPLGNNDLENFLVSEGAEPRLPGLFDFILYCTYNGIMDRKLYGRNAVAGQVYRIVYAYFSARQRELLDIINEHGVFTAPTPFSHAIELVRDYIGLGAKMGEGWLLPAEMLELMDVDVKNIVCTQPFGCLPNHIMGKGMMKPLKEKNENVNIVAIDYDPGATRINQENRIKLMLANARREMETGETGETGTFLKESAAKNFTPEKV